MLGRGGAPLTHQEFSRLLQGTQANDAGAPQGRRAAGGAGAGQGGVGELALPLRPGLQAGGAAASQALPPPALS